MAHNGRLELGICQGSSLHISPIKGHPVARVGNLHTVVPCQASSESPLRCLQLQPMGAAGISSASPASRQPLSSLAVLPHSCLGIVPGGEQSLGAFHHSSYSLFGCPEALVDGQL